MFEPVQIIAPNVSLVNGNPATTSLAIAECFSKRHDHVMRDIQNLIAQCPEEFRAPNFGETFREVAGPNNATRKEAYYIVFFDGFILLVMGYTGKKALAMKLAYISAFNAMREKLEHGGKDELPPDANSPLTPDQQRTLQDIVDSKVYAIAGGSGPQRKVFYSRIWGNFNKHFRIAKYCQLPQSRLSEGIAYLVNMEVREQKELPKQEALPPATDKYAAYIQEVEAFRARTATELEILLQKGIHLVDVYRFGPEGISGFTPVLIDWLQSLAGQRIPLLNPRDGIDRAIEYSPLGLMKGMEARLADRRK